MANNNVQLRGVIQTALAKFGDKPLGGASINLLGALGYTSDKVAEFASKPAEFIKDIEEATSATTPIQRDKILLDKWKECAFLFQLTNDEIPSLAIGQQSLVADNIVQREQMESFVYLAIELQGEDWSRTDLATITRELNKRFPMPAIVLFKHGTLVSLAVIDRRINRRDSSKDVIDGRRISIIKDIRCSKPHSAHLHILSGLAIENLGEKHRPTNFRELYEAWIKALSIQTLNEKFYKELFYWYLYAVKTVQFPRGGGEVEAKRNSVAVIRLLTRLIFVWFIKEKGLVPDDLFERDKLGTLLKSDPTSHPDDSTYYLAVLQNLFFATLNVEMGTDEQGRPWRRWSEKSKTGGQSGHYLIHSVYRYKEDFKDPDAALQLYGTIPFLNGGLFECLDRELTDLDFQRNPDLKKLAVKEGNGWVLRIDGFSRRSEAQPTVPNKLFFGGEQHVDLNADLATKGKEYDVHGLIDIFNQYKFTVDENTPVEEEVALDPELLGKVFENLLASYNEDTKTTARKQTGSFYTPREVVDYMVDEALVAYFERQLDPKATDETLAPRLRQLLSYADEEFALSDDEKVKLIAAIERLTILDPACGSGAFPMGALAKLVHLLKKLDTDNILWRAQNRAPLEGQLREAGKIPDPNMREDKVEEAEAALAKFDRDFSEANYPDYTRKLYLIEKCIHGVDIQPIAVQIAKLRFFISLIVSQKVDDTKDNRNITALPNLETKIVAADSLIPIDKPEQMGLRDFAIDDKEKELASANEHYFAARTGKTKRKWRDRIFTMRDELANLLEKDRFLSKGAARQLVHWNPFDQNAAAGFFDPEWMFQLKDGFDVVIGNPPYIRHEVIRDLTPILKNVYHYECASSRADLYVFFYERSIRLLKPGGVLSFITSNKWYRAKYGEGLRQFMSTNSRIRRIIDFGDEEVFTAIAYPTIVIATRREQIVKVSPKGEELLALNWSHDIPVESFPSVFAAESFAVPLAELKKDGWQLEPPIKRLLLSHIRNAGTPLGEYVHGRLYRGVITGLNEAFVIDVATRNQLIAEDPKSADLIKPYIRGRDVKRWRTEWAGLYLIVVPFGFHEELSRYPAILRHLSQFENELRKRGQCTSSRSGKGEGQHHWLELDNNPKESYLSEFERPKIFVPAIEDGVEYAPDMDGYFGNDKTNIIVADDWRYVVAILNSSVSWWITQQTFSGKQGGFYEFKPMYVSQLPIPSATAPQKCVFDGLVNVVLKTRDPRIDQLINGLVYELFFPEDLHKANIHLFTEAEKAAITKLASLEGEELIAAASKLAEKIFSTNHPIYGMLFDLQGLDVVRIIEGRE